MATQHAKAELLHHLHHADRPLVLANVWDPAGALLVAAAGARAVATASASVSWTLGVADGGGLDRERAVAQSALIAAAVDLPVTADVEDGYGETPAEVGATVAALIAAGAVGANLEDGAPDGVALRPLDDAVRRVAAARAAAETAGLRLFLNARTDVFLREVGDPADRLEVAVERARAFVEAGADGVFVPGVADAETIGTLAKAVGVPLNVLAAPGSPGIAELGGLGVARVSLGPGLAKVAYAAVHRAAQELYESGGYGGLAGGLTYGELNGLFAN